MDGEADLFLVVPDGATGDSGHNLQVEVFRLSLRRRLFPRRLEQLPREAAEGLVLELWRLCWTEARLT